MIRTKKSMETRATSRVTSIAATAVVAISLASCSGKLLTATPEDGGIANTGGARNGTGGQGTGGAQDLPAAQGAVTFKISPSPGQTCRHTNAQLSMPAAQNAGVFGELLGCNLSTGCRPDEFVVVDRDRGTTIACNVSPVGDNFNVNITMNVEGSPNMQFQANGQLTKTGGMLAINETNSAAQGGGSDYACLVSIQPNAGVVAKGKIWAQFTCTAFRDPNDLGDTGCTMEGAFLFENCGG
jgi:hypothetical protein